MIAALGAKDIRTIVVARAPEKRAAVGSTAWLAPYWGLVRGAPVVLIHAASAAVAEADVGRLVRRHGLQPRTITVLADYDSIGDNFVEIESDAAPLPSGDGAPAAAAGKYQLNTEPFVPTDASKPASFGVGRIPLQSLGDASVLFARGLVRRAHGGGPGVAGALDRQFGTRPSPLAAVRDNQPRDGRRIQELRACGGRILRQIGRWPRGLGGGEAGGIDPLRGPPGVSGLVRTSRRPTGTPLRTATSRRSWTVLREGRRCGEASRGRRRLSLGGGRRRRKSVHSAAP